MLILFCFNCFHQHEFSASYNHSVFFSIFYSTGSFGLRSRSLPIVMEVEVCCFGWRSSLKNGSSCFVWSIDQDQDVSFEFRCCFWFIRTSAMWFDYIYGYKLGKILDICFNFEIMKMGLFAYFTFVKWVVVIFCIFCQFLNQFDIKFYYVIANWILLLHILNIFC